MNKTKTHYTIDNTQKSIDVYHHYEAEKLKIMMTSRSSEEYESRIAALVKRLKL